MKKFEISLTLLMLFFFSGCVQPDVTDVENPGNQEPIIKKVKVFPAEIAVGETSSIQVVAIDPDGDRLSYSWSVDLGDIIGDGANVFYAAAYCCAGRNNITVTVKDSRGSSVSRKIEIFVK